MRKKDRFLLGILTLCFISPVQAADSDWEKKLPPSALKMLDSFPKRKVTLDLVVGRAMQYSDSFKAVKASFAGIETALLDAQAPYDMNLNLSVSRSINENEPQSAFSTNQIFQTEYSIGTAKLFPTGTLLSAEITNGSTFIGFQSISASSFFESVANFQLTQSLWKDAFGSGTRKNRAAGEKLRDAADFSFQDSVETWVTDLITLFYNAWLTQTQTKAEIENINRRKRLVDITKVKFRRGTSEKPDLLQVEAALLNAQTRFQETSQRLHVIWRQLVTALKMPEEWLTINPTYIPMELDQPIAQARSLCGSEATLGASPKSSTLTNKTRKEAEAAQLSLESAESLARPDLRLELGLSANGIDAKRWPSFNEALAVKNPAWSVGLFLELPLLGNSTNESNVRRALVSRDTTEALASLEASNLKTEWMNTCHDLFRLIKSTEVLDRSYQKQLERARLEENRFRIGRIQALNVIQAGDDATTSQINYSNFQINTRLAAWKVLRLYGELKKYVQSLAKKEYKLESS